MDVIEAIHSRSSIGKVLQDPVDRALIEELIEAAIQAPNHRVTEPWRFFVVSGEARQDLGELMERVLLQSKPNASDEERARERAKPLRAPVLIIVTSASGKDQIETTENFAATAAAVENLLLAAHAREMGAQWRTGPVAYAPETKQWLAVPDDTAIVACVYLGYPNMEPKPRRRTQAREKTVWVAGV